MSVLVIRRKQCRIHSTRDVHEQPGRERPLRPRLEPVAGPRRGVAHAPAAVLERISRPAKNAGRRWRRTTRRMRSTCCDRGSSPSEARTSNVVIVPALRRKLDVRMSEKHALGVPRVVPRSAVAATPSRRKNRPRSSSRVLPATARRYLRHREAIFRPNRPLPGGGQSVGSPREKRSSSHARATASRICQRSLTALHASPTLAVWKCTLHRSGSRFRRTPTA